MKRLLATFAFLSAVLLCGTAQAQLEITGPGDVNFTGPIAFSASTQSAPSGGCTTDCVVTDPAGGALQTINGPLALSNLNLFQGGCVFFDGGTAEFLCPDGSGGLKLTASPTSTYGLTFTAGSTVLYRMDPSGNLINTLGDTVLPGSATGNTGTGNVVMSNSPVLTGSPQAPTVLNCGGLGTQIATVGTINNCLTAIGPGVSSINGYGGAWTFTGGGINCNTSTLVCTVSSTPIALVTLQLPAGLVAAPGSCYAWTGSAWGLRPATTPATISMPGILVPPSSTVPALLSTSFQGSADSTTGWGKVGGLDLRVWASANDTASWDVCNPTTGTITSGAPYFTVGARN